MKKFFLILIAIIGFGICDAYSQRSMTQEDSTSTKVSPITPLDNEVSFYFAGFDEVEQEEDGNIVIYLFYQTFSANHLIAKGTLGKGFSVKMPQKSHVKFFIVSAKEGEEILDTNIAIFKDKFDERIPLSNLGKLDFNEKNFYEIIVSKSQKRGRSIYKFILK